MKTYILLSLLLLGFTACKNNKQNPLTEETIPNEEDVTSNIDIISPEEMENMLKTSAYYDIIKNNNWCGLGYIIRFNINTLSKNEKQQRIDSGKELYSNHFNEVIDTTNFFKDKSLFDQLLKENTDIYAVIDYAYRSKKKIFVLYSFDSLSPPQYLIR